MTPWWGLTMQRMILEDWPSFQHLVGSFLVHQTHCYKTLYLWQSASSPTGAGQAECACSWCSSRWKNPAAPLYQPAPHSKTGVPPCSATPSLEQGTEWKMTPSSFKLQLVMLKNCALDCQSLHWHTLSGLRLKQTIKAVSSKCSQYHTTNNCLKELS